MWRTRAQVLLAFRSLYAGDAGLHEAYGDMAGELAARFADHPGVAGSVRITSDSGLRPRSKPARGTRMEHPPPFEPKNNEVGWLPGAAPNACYPRRAPLEIMRLWLLPLCLACAPEDPVQRAEPGRSGPPPADTASDDSGATPADDSPTDNVLSPAVEILSPADASDVQNPVTFRVLLADVAYASLDADGWPLGDFTEPGESSLDLTFTGTGYPRVVTLTGFDDEGAPVATHSVTIEVEADGVNLEVPYFYQYDNANEPSGTCGVTSAAMLVDYWNPGSVTPDTLYREYGKAQGQSPSGLAGLYEAEGLYAEHGTSATRADLRTHLDAGRPVVVHGYWTSAGHITVIVGYTDADWIVNDPAGDWYTCYGCGEADHIAYPIGGAWDAELSVDGDIWWSTGADAPF